MKKVLLIGIGGVFNYGCEAIIRGSVDILKRNIPGVEIYYASYNYCYDFEKLKDCDVKVIERKRGRMIFRRSLKKLLSFLGVKYNIPYDSLSWIRKYGFDTVLSIGGDIYTLSAKGEYNESLPRFCEKLQSMGMRYFLWGASVGPFTANKKAERFFKNHLEKVDKIVCREENTVKYLNSIGIYNNVVLAPDPAFFVSDNDSVTLSYEEKKYIGLNLSPLSSLHFYKNLDLAVEVQAGIISGIIKKYDKEVLLLPHVFSFNIYDNDLDFLKKVYDWLPDEYKKKTILVSEDLGFIGIKKYIRQCCSVVAARMHCAINSIACDVPAIFLSYSEKSRGMSEYVYGTDKYAIKLSDIKKLEEFDLTSLPEINRNFLCDTYGVVLE